MSAKRTRTGCLCCRRRHKKCDEQKPSCQFCLSKGIQCEWPKKGSVFVNYQTTNEISLPENTGVSFMASSFVLDTFDTSTSKIITRPLPQQEKTVRKRSASAPKPIKSSFDASASSLPSRGPFNPHYSINITTTSPSPTPTPPFCTSSPPPTGEANTSSISSISQHSNSPKSTVLSFPLSHPFNFNYSFNTTESSIQPAAAANPALGTPLAYQNQYYQQRHNSLPPLRDLYYGLIQPPMRDSIQAVTQSTLVNCSLISTSSTNSASSGVKKFSVDSLLN